MAPVDQGKRHGLAGIVRTRQAGVEKPCTNGGHHLAQKSRSAVSRNPPTDEPKTKRRRLRGIGCSPSQCLWCRCRRCTLAVAGEMVTGTQTLGCNRKPQPSKAYPSVFGKRGAGRRSVRQQIDLPMI